jgi:hypothetical protein
VCSLLKEHTLKEDRVMSNGGFEKEDGKCESLGIEGGGVLTCANPKLDTTACCLPPVCGNNVQHDQGEICDLPPPHGSFFDEGEFDSLIGKHNRHGRGR